MRQLYAAVRACQHAEWSRSLLVAECVVNSQQLLGKKRRRWKSLQHLNPWEKGGARRASNRIVLRGERGDKILDAMADNVGPDGQILY